MARKLIDKPRNNGTLTEAGFWAYIRSSLRQRSLRGWKPLQECKKRARRPYEGENNRQKWEYQCANCKNWFMEKEIHVDHIVDAGSLRNGDDLKGFIERLFCEIDGLQVLCKDKCHREKTNEVITEKKLSRVSGKTKIFEEGSSFSS